MDKSSNLIWIDLEMTGLDTTGDTIIEIATIVTDKHLNELAEGPVLAVGQPQATMDAMDEWNTRQHGESGLTARVIASDNSLQDAERGTIAFLSEWVDEGVSRRGCDNNDEIQVRGERFNFATQVGPGQLIAAIVDRCDQPVRLAGDRFCADRVTAYGPQLLTLDAGVFFIAIGEPQSHAAAVSCDYGRERCCIFGGHLRARKWEWT